MHRLRRAIEQRFADAPAAQVKFDASAVRHAGVQVHVEVPIVAAQATAMLREVRRFGFVLTLMRQPEQLRR